MRRYNCKIYITAVALLASLMLSLVSCRGEEKEPQDDALTLTDALGREVTLEKNPSRVAALLGSFADVWVLAGGVLVAAPQDAWEDFGLDRTGVVDLGGAHSPSLEALVSASPDLVLASASTASNVEMLGTLEAMGIAVVYFDVDHFEDYLSMLDVCTQLTGRRDLYEQNGLAVKRQIDEIKERYASSEIPEAERKILLLRAASSFVKAKGSRGTILGEMLSDMGCINVADQNEGLLENLSAEAVIREEPYRIFVVTMGNSTEAAEASLEKLIKENPAWGTLGAVREGRLYVMDKTLFNLKPNDRWAESYEILYEKLTEK